MEYYKVTFLSGLEIVLEALTREDARVRALEQYPTEEINEIIYLSII
jgi:hypothetical protein